MLFEHLKIALQVSVSSMLIIDDNGTIITANEMTSTLFGYNSKELCGKKIEMLLPPDTRSRHQIHRQEYNKKPERRRMGTGFDIFGLNKEQTKIPIEVYLNRVKTDEGYFTICTVLDIKARKAFEHKLIEVNESLEQKVIERTNKLQRNVNELKLIYEGTLSSTQATSFESALRNCLLLVCEHLSLFIGHAYLVDTNTNQLCNTDLWHVYDTDIDLAQIKKITQDAHEKCGLQLAKKTVEKKQMQQVEGLQSEKKLRRNLFYKEHNLNSALCFPIIIESKVIAVLEFLSKDILPNDEELKNVFNVLANQLSRVYIAKQSEEKLETLAHYDSITHVPNRSFFFEILSHAISKVQRTEKNLAVIYLDLDSFKKINDTLGHAGGDVLLRQAAIRIKETARDTDIVARIGGDEFVILAEDLDSPQEASLIARRVVRSFQQPFIIDKHEAHTTISAGIAIFPHAGKTRAELLEHADTAMYYAKERGRNNYQFFSQELNQDNLRKLLVEDLLRNALTNNEMFLVYHPQIDLTSGKVFGVEALLRWHNSHLGDVSPVEFIKIAEDCGMVLDIGEWVFRKACEQYKIWRQEFGEKIDHFKLSINFSMHQLMHQNVPAIIKRVFSDYNINGDRSKIMLEITETTLMTNLDLVTNILREVHDMGIGIAVDDFGTGYSSLNYLKQLPITTLKIDRSFVTDIANDPNDAAIVKAIIQLGRALDLEIIAEGVETQDQLSFLRRNQCHYAQGFYISKPLDVNDMTTFITTRLT